MSTASRLQQEHILLIPIFADLDVNRQDENGMTALMWAAANNQILTVQYLLNEHSANPHVITPNKENALLLASAQGHHQVVSVLLQNGVDINHVSQVLSDVG